MKLKCNKRSRTYLHGFEALHGFGVLPNVEPCSLFIDFECSCQLWLFCVRREPVESHEKMRDVWLMHRGSWNVCGLKVHKNCIQYLGSDYKVSREPIHFCSLGTLLTSRVEHNKLKSERKPFRGLQRQYGKGKRRHGCFTRKCESAKILVGFVWRDVRYLRIQKMSFVFMGSKHRRDSIEWD